MDNSYNPYPRRQASLEGAAMVLATISVVCCLICYISIPCGAMAIILGVLSRGGQMNFSKQAKYAIALGAITMALTVIIYTYAIVTMLQEYGSVQGILEEYASLMGMSYDELMETLGGQ